MTDRPPGFVMPSAATWEHAAQAAETATREVLAECGFRAMTKPSGQALLFAPALGALVAAGGFIRATANPEGLHVAEQWALATLRGAIRGADGAIHDNGTPMTRATDG